MDIWYVIKEMLHAEWGFDGTKIIHETLKVDEMVKLDLGIDIFRGAGFISSGAPPGKGQNGT